MGHRSPYPDRERWLHLALYLPDKGPKDMAKPIRCFYKGNFRKDAREDANARKGWFVGAFDGLQRPRMTELVEIKYWKYKKGKVNHEPKTSCTIECTLILKGSVRGMVGDGDVKLEAGQYVVIAPGTPNALPQKVTKNVEGLTIKAPSITVAKHLLKKKVRDEIWLGEIKRCDP